MGHAYIKQQYLNINDDEFNPTNDTIKLNYNISQNAATEMEEEDMPMVQFVFYLVLQTH